MKAISILTITAFVFSIYSCGGGAKESDHAEEVIKSNNPLIRAGEEMKEKMATYEVKYAERRKKGDTLAMHYKELQKFLPETVSGYTRGDPDGQSMTMQGLSYSSASVDFKNTAGNSLRINLIDYNAAYNLFAMATTTWAANMSFENDREKANSIKLDNGIAGWEVYKKDDKEATITLGIGYRFILIIETEAQENSELAKSVAKSMEIEKLSEM